VLVMEHAEGVGMGDAIIGALPQDERNEITCRIIELCLWELFQFRLMQTDPNFTNFLWHSKTQQLSLIDFCTRRECKKEFMDNWLRLHKAAASEDRASCADLSWTLEYLTGEGNEIMLDGSPGDPFQTDDYTFGSGIPWVDITARIWTTIPVMLKHRLTPPPRESIV